MSLKRRRCPDTTPRRRMLPRKILKQRRHSEESAGLSPEQIDKAIERVINEKFAGRIENIIYEVIEKAVAKEIDRLKGVLLDSIPPDDDY